MPTTTSYRVAGMTCDHCVRAVTEEVGALPGVLDVSVTLNPETVSTVRVTSEDVADDAAVAAAVDEAGYEVRP